MVICYRANGSIRMRPQLDFLLIINPNSGPGEDPPHEDYLRALPLLRQAAAPGQAVEQLVSRHALVTVCSYMAHAAPRFSGLRPHRVDTAWR